MFVFFQNMQCYLATSTLFLLSLAPFVLCAPSETRLKAKVMSDIWNEANSADDNHVGKRALEDNDKFWKRGEQVEGFWKRGDSNQALTDLIMNIREYLAHRAEASKRSFDGSAIQKAERRRQEAAMIRPEFNPTGW